MDYEKAYKETIDKLRKLHNDWNSTQNRAAKEIESVFSELKESEDERIRKCLLSHFSRYQEDEIFLNSITMKQIVAWLEKQGELKNIQTVNDAWKDMRLEVYAQATGNRHEPNYADDSTKLFSLNDIDEIIEKISEKQGEQKSDRIQWTGDNLKDVIEFTGYSPKFDKWFENWKEYETYVHSHNNIFKMFNEDGSHYEVPVGAWIVKTPDGHNVASKATYVQKLTDKVESKFKVGDWIVEPREDKPDYLWHIDRIKDDCYRYDAISAGIKIAYADKECHLWTIQDAKDGDVLVAHDVIFMYKRTLANHIVSYCKLINDIFESNVDARTCCEDNTYVYPATKEQRNKLEKAITEAGYEWDAEKKKLKKIEQKSTQEIESFKAEHGKYYYCIKDYFCGGKRQASKGDVIQALRGLSIMGLKDASEYFLPVNSIKCNFAWSEEDKKIINALITVCLLPHDEMDGRPWYKWADWLKCLLQRFSLQLKQEWSEEDEKKLNGICMYIMCSDSPEGYTEWIKFLKSLKYRVQPQPKKEWSEEDERILNRIQDHLRESYVDKKGYPYVAKSDSPEITERNWLNSIKDRVRPQSKHGWSEEDEELFDAVIADIQFTQKAHNHEVNQVVYEREIDWLKSLKERMKGE